MAKGYWIARVDVRDAEGYKGYVASAKPAFERFGRISLPAAALPMRSKGPGVPAT